MRVLAATVATLALAALATASAGASPTRTAKLTAAEQKWVTPVVGIWNVMNGSLAVVYKQTTAASALIAGTKNNKTLVYTLANFVECSRAMAKAKAPPTARLNTFAGTMKSACTSLKTGALGVANGISSIGKSNSKLGVLQIKEAYKDLQRGSSKLAAAQKQLFALSGKKISGS